MRLIDVLLNPVVVIGVIILIVNTKLRTRLAQKIGVFLGTFTNVTMGTMNSLGLKIFAAIVVLIVISAMALRFLVVIPAGFTGVYVLFGKVSATELHSGINFVNPLGRVVKMSTRTEEYTMSIANAEGQRLGDDSISALTNEGLNVKLDITVLYHLDESKADDIYKNVGLNFVEKVIRPSIRSIIREEVAKYSAKEIYSDKREELSVEILQKLETDLKDRGIIVEDVLLRNVQLPAQLAKSIQDKLTAEQEAQKYDFVLDKATKEAERKRIEARGQRDSQQIINESLTDRYLEYLYIQSLKDREGTIYVPTNPDNGLPMFKNVP